MQEFREIIKRHVAWRVEHPDATAVKINLYKPVEAEAVALAVQQHPELAEACRVECVMMADSFLMTHLGRKTTVVKDGEHDLLLDFVVSMVADVTIALRESFPDPLSRPFIMGDMPDGPAQAVDTSLAAAERLVAAGSQCVKLEVTSDMVYDAIEELAKRGIPVIGHIGYTPQGGESSNRRHGGTLEDANAFFARARRVRDAGASGMVLERVAPEVNDALCRNAARDFIIYSIFSGRGTYGGQSLNIFDAVIRPDLAGVKFFPPTAKYGRDVFLDVYNRQTIASHLAELMAMTGRKEFPLTAKSTMAADVAAAIAEVNPWHEPAMA